MISFEVTNGGSAVQICCDDRGIDALVDILAKLRGSGTHVHLYAPSRTHGRRELTDENPFGEEAVKEVIITHGAYSVHTKYFIDNSKFP